MSALGFHVSSRIMTLDSAGYSYLSLVSQHTLPTQAYAADALAAETANITVAVTAAKTYFIFTPLIAPRLSATGVTHLSSLYGRELGEPQITIAEIARRGRGTIRVRVSALNRFNNSFLSRDPQRGSNRQTCNADQDNVACILITKRLFGCCGNIGDLVPQIMLLAASTLQYCFTGAFRL